MIDNQRQPMPMVQGLPTAAMTQIYQDERVIGKAKRGGFTIVVIAVVRGWWCNALRVAAVELGSTLEYETQATTQEDAIKERRRFEQFAKTIVSDKNAGRVVTFTAAGTAEFYPEVIEQYARWCERVSEFVDEIEAVAADTPSESHPERSEAE